MKKGTVYFFTGLAGAGKTTIGGLFYRRMKERKNDLVLLDGDQLRRLSFNKQSRYTTEERREGAFYNFEMCNMLAEQGIDVSLYSDFSRGYEGKGGYGNSQEAQAINRTMLRNYDNGIYNWLVSVRKIR